jgi:hypothetical protein
MLKVARAIGFVIFGLTVANPVCADGERRIWTAQTLGEVTAGYDAENNRTYIDEIYFVVHGPS